MSGTLTRTLHTKRVEGMCTSTSYPHPKDAREGSCVGGHVSHTCAETEEDG